MFNKILFILFLHVAGLGIIQDNGPVKLDWDTHFKGAPDKNSPFSAQTALKFAFSYHSTISRNNLSLDFKFSAEVDPLKSWVKRETIRQKAASDALLNHEQGHVNINYLQMLEAEKQLTTAKYKIKNYKKEIEEIASKVGDRYNEIQKRYDEETNHGNNQEKQLEWDKLIEGKIIP